MNFRGFTVAASAKRAFTLAEVLITLAIIGVVAAMTVPALMTSTRGKEYEVGANKALSTLSNAMQMRYAMDGTAVIDYICQDCSQGVNSKILEYLTATPQNARPGEQPALPTVSKNDKAKNDATGANQQSVVKLKDGMFLIVPIQTCGTGSTAGAGRYAHYLAFDTNGEKGPSRTNLNTRYQVDGAVYGTAGVGPTEDPILGMQFKLKDTSTGITIPASGNFVERKNVAPTNNDNPDIVVFAIDPYTGTIIPAGQRTRNILATGNALISQ